MILDSVFIFTLYVILKLFDPFQQRKDVLLSPDE